MFYSEELPKKGSSKPGARCNIQNSSESDDCTVLACCLVATSPQQHENGWVSAPQPA